VAGSPVTLPFGEVIALPGGHALMSLERRYRMSSDEFREIARDRDLARPRRTGIYSLGQTRRQAIPPADVAYDSGLAGPDSLRTASRHPGAQWPPRAHAGTTRPHTGRPRTHNSIECTFTLHSASEGSQKKRLTRYDSPAPTMPTPIIPITAGRVPFRPAASHAVL